MSTSESKVPTKTFLLPGQQFCVGLPWEREGLPVHGLPPAPMAPPPPQNPFDKAELLADPCAGLEIGSCQVIRKLSTASANMMLAMRNDPREGTALVALRKLDLPDEGMQDLLEHAHWASHFRHPNLARVYGSEASDEGIFWVTEFASGATLHEIEASCRKIGKAVPVGLALSTAYDIALALAELHVPGSHAHGFVSDESLFISFDGLPKLLDLGLFRCIAGKILRPEGLSAMAPYLSPEQVTNGRMPDPKTDVYSLAAVLHECLSGQKLPNGFERQPHFVPPSSFNIALGKELDAVFAKALDADRAQRFRNAEEFARALKSASSPFMWKPAQRAEFVSQLFQTRKRREQVLMAGCEEIVWKPKRMPTMPKLPVVVEAPAQPPPAPKQTISLRAQPQPKKSRTKKRRTVALARRPLKLALLAAALALVCDRGFVNDLLFPRRISAAAPQVALALANPPPPQPQGVAEEKVLESARTVYVPRPKVKVVARKKKDEAPLPPWLRKR